MDPKPEIDLSDCDKPATSRWLGIGFVLGILGALAVGVYIVHLFVNDIAPGAANSAAKSYTRSK